MRPIVCQSKNNPNNLFRDLPKMPIVQVSDSNGNNGDTISNKADYFFHAIRLMYCFFVEIETPLVTFNYINYN